MALYTSDYLKRVATSKTPQERQNLSEQRSGIQGGFDIFLSHSFLDKDEVEGLYLELRRMGFSVYVDWIVDPHLDRGNVTKETAEHIRRRLRSSKTLLLAISANAALSKWMPWELGYADGHTEKCAIVPISRDNLTRASFTRTEYLALYPFIEKPNNLNFRDKLWTVEGPNTYVEFDSWLRGLKPEYGSTRFF